MCGQLLKLRLGYQGQVARHLLAPLLTVTQYSYRCQLPPQPLQPAAKRTLEPFVNAM